MEKNFSIANKLDANFPHNYSISTKTYGKENAYDNFGVLNNRIPQKTQYAIVVPDYVTLTYKCIVSTYYMEQMNKLIEQVSFEDDEYWGDRNRYKFRTRIDEYKMDNSLPVEKDRLVKTTFTLNVSAYLLPERMVDKHGRLMQTTQERFSVKKVVTFIETETR
jgi:hypothetical protein